VEWTDIRESKRPLRLILLNEIRSFCRIFWTYKLGHAKKFLQ
jgi:hypothetical protein